MYCNVINQLLYMFDLLGIKDSDYTVMSFTDPNV